MTIEKSKGKARPTLPRSNDLGAARPTPTKKPRRRGANRAVRDMVATTSADPVVREVANAAATMHRAYMKEMPQQGPLVNSLAANCARHMALAAFFYRLATEAGLGTDAGLAWLDRSMAHDKRAERLAVTSLDAAKHLAAASVVDDDALVRNARLANVVHIEENDE